MSKETIFEVFEGMIQMQYAFWSKTDSTDLPIDDGRMTFYGKGDTTPLYFHIRLQDLFAKSGGAWRILENTEIHVDFLSIDYSMYDTLQKEEDFANIGKYVEIIDSIKLNLTRGKKVTFNDGAIINNFELPNTVEWTEYMEKFNAYLTKLPSRNGVTDTALNAYEYDLSFKFEDKIFKKKFFTKSIIRKYIFAWVWVAHDKSKEEYKAGLNITITDPANRIDMLKNPKKNFFGAFDLLFSPKSKVKRYSRAELYMKKFNDGYPYDEQSFNCVEISQCLPFKSFSIGAQIGKVGICTMDTQYFDRHINDHRTYTSVFLVNKKPDDPFPTVPSIHCRLDSDTDDNFKPDLVGEHGVVLHGLKSKLNEFYSRADNRFFFREKSVSHWINSLEKDYPGSSYDNGLSTVYTNGEYPFSKGKLELFSHDFVKKYRSDNELLQRFAGPDRFIEQKTIDLSSFKSVHVAPAGEIKSDDGSFFVRIGKGIPADEQFIDTIHTDVFFKEDKDSWQAHAICHRPLIITYELDRDLTSEELETIETNPIRLLFWKGKPEGKKTPVEYQLKINYSLASSKGSHAILLYLLTNEVKLEVSVDGSRLVPTDNWLMSDGAPARLFDCNCSLVENFKYYIPENTGLFLGNPIIVVDDFQEDEVKIKALAKIRKDYHTSMNNAGAKFLLGFVPGFAGEALSYGWEIFSEWQETGTVDKKKVAKKLCEEGLRRLLEQGMKKKDIEKELQRKNEAIREENDREEDRSKDAVNKGKEAFFEQKQKEIDIDEVKNSPSEEVRQEREYIKNEVSQHVSTAKDQIQKGLKFTAEIAKITTTYMESSSLLSSPFFDGAGFGDKPKSDSLYLLAVGVKDFITDPKTLVTSLTSSGESLAFFKNRVITRDDGREPFNYQLGDTGGLLARKKKDPVDSIKSFRVGFQEKLAVLKENFSKNPAVTVPDYINRFASQKLDEKYTDMLKKAGGNPTLISYFESNGLAQKFNKALKGGAKLNDLEKAELTAFLNLAMYIDSTFIFCPACGNMVSLSWGWCPYHATREWLQLKDGNGDGKFKEEFIKYLNINNLDSIRKHLTTDYDTNTRHLVHWTEFVIN